MFESKSAVCSSIDDIYLLLEVYILVSVLPCDDVFGIWAMLLRRITCAELSIDAIDVIFSRKFSFEIDINSDVKTCKEMG